MWYGCYILRRETRIYFNDWEDHFCIHFLFVVGHGKCGSATWEHILKLQLSCRDFTYHGDGSPPRRSSIRANKNRRAEFLSRSGTMSPRGNLWKRPKQSPTWSNSPVKGTCRYIFLPFSWLFLGYLIFICIFACK